jgi:hypothetical protein
MGETLLLLVDVQWADRSSYYTDKSFASVDGGWRG